MTEENDYDDSNEVEKENDYLQDVHSNFNGTGVSDPEVSLTEASIRLEAAIEDAEDADVRRESLRGFRHVLKALTLEQNGGGNGG